MGLIDILTQYDAKKKAAHAAKTVKHGVSLIHVFLEKGNPSTRARTLSGLEKACLSLPTASTDSAAVVLVALYHACVQC